MRAGGGWAGGDAEVAGARTLEDLTSPTRSRAQPTAVAASACPPFRPPLLYSPRWSSVMVAGAARRSEESPSSTG